MEIFNNIFHRANINLETFNNLCRKNDIGTDKLWRHNICKQTINMIEAKFNCIDFNEFVIGKYMHHVGCWFTD